MKLNFNINRGVIDFAGELVIPVDCESQEFLKPDKFNLIFDCEYKLEISNEEYWNTVHMTVNSWWVEIGGYRKKLTFNEPVAYHVLEQFAVFEDGEVHFLDLKSEIEYCANEIINEPTASDIIVEIIDNANKLYFEIEKKQ